MNQDKALRDHVIQLLQGGNAHATFDEAVEGLSKEYRGLRLEHFPHTAWQLLEHLRISQWDILEFSRNPDHISPDWPDQYWPVDDAPPDDSAWDKSVDAFRIDLVAMQDLILNPDTDLLAKIPHGKGQTMLREALVLADHNSYHIGQLIMLRKAMGTWQDNS